MRSQLRLSSIILVLALVLSLVPAAALVRPAAAATADWAQFVADVTIPDGTRFAPGTAFQKTWRLKNIGTATWTTGYSLVFDSGDRFGAQDVNFPINVAPGQTVDLTLNMTAPASAGHYFSYWKLKNASGVIFGIGTTANKAFWAEIYVTGTTGPGYDFTANAASAAWSSGSGALTFPGTDGSASGFALKKDAPKFESGVTSSQAGLLFAPNNVTNGYIQAVYPAFRVERGDRFQATIGCEYGSTACYVAYRLDYQIGTGAVRTFWTFREKYEGLTYPANLDLSSLAGSDVKFILVVSAYGSPVGDRALWGNPVIARQGPPPPPPPSSTKFDFGTASSPLAAGYTRVTEATSYSASGYGWTDTAGVESRDRSAVADDLKRDFVTHASAARTFKVNLANGTYSVAVTMGDNDYAHDNMVVKANGTTVLADVDAAVATYATNTFNVSVTGGSLSLEFSDAGGADPSWVVNAVTVTPGSLPPPAGCDRAQFIADVTVPDGTVFAPGIAFSKTWRLKNIGTCTWTTSYALMFDSGEKMSGPDTAPMPTNVAPGQTVDITISLTSPTTAGTYRGYWKFKNANGVPFGIGTGGTKSWWVEIKVAGTGTVPLTPVTPVAGTQYDFATNACSAAWFSGAGQLPCPGTEGDARGFVLKQSSPKLENGTISNLPGLLTYPQNVTNGYIQGYYPPYTVKTGDRFRSIVNCEGGATSCYAVFRLDYQIGSGSVQNFWYFGEKHENPGQYFQADMSLAPLVGQSVKFVLTVLSVGSPVGDRALWVGPIIYNGSSGPTPTATPTLPLTQTPTATATATATTPAPASFKYDFGTASSPVAAGFTKVTETTAYAAGSFGWTDTAGLESRDRSALADDLKRDFVTHASAARIFKVDLPNGTYAVSLTMGDNDYPHEDMVVKANGATVLGDVDSAAGAFTVNTFNVTVSGGSLTLEFSDAGGADPSWIVNGVTITLGT